MIAWRQIISGSTGPIFAIFSPNDRYLFVDDGHLDFFSQFLKGCCHSDQFCAKIGKMTLHVIRQAGVPKWVGIWQFRFESIHRQYCSYISCACLVKIGLVTPEIARVTTATIWTRRKKSAYSDLHHVFSIGRRGDYKA